MTRQEAIAVIEVAKAEIEWEYPLNYQVALDLAIRSLEAWEEVVDELLHIDKPTDFGGYEDGAYNGVTLAIRTINKHLSEIES